MFHHGCFRHDCPVWQKKKCEAKDVAWSNRRAPVGTGPSRPLFLGPSGARVSCSASHEDQRLSAALSHLVGTNISCQAASRPFAPAIAFALRCPLGAAGQPCAFWPYPLRAPGLISSTAPSRDSQSHWASRPALGTSVRRPVRHVSAASRTAHPHTAPFRTRRCAALSH